MAMAARSRLMCRKPLFPSPVFGLVRQGLRRGLSAVVGQPEAAAAEPCDAALPPAPSRSMQKRLSSRGLHWIFLGCPGVGKSTYASRVAKYLDIPHIAMGELVRNELSQSTPAGKHLASLANQGKLLPDDVIMDLLCTRFSKGVEAGETGFILDGFPRNCHQAEMLEEVADIDLVVNLRLREDVLIMKCLGRRICSGCGTNYNVSNINVEGVNGNPSICMPALLPPPACATKLQVRHDDTEEVVRARLRIYAEESKPVEEHYRGQGKLLDFDVAGGVTETWPKLLAALKLDYTDDEAKKMVA